MAIEFDIDGPEETPILAHNAAVRENLYAIVAIKEYIGENDLYEACGVFHLLPDDIKSALWLATTKGGIFTTQERRVMQSNEWGEALRAYIKEETKI